MLVVQENVYLLSILFDQKEAFSLIKMSFISAILDKDLSRVRPVTSHVSHCDRATLVLIKVVLSKCRKLGTSLTGVKDLFQNND